MNTTPMLADDVTPKYQITVFLNGRDRNCYHIMNAVGDALRKARITPDEINKYVDEAMAARFENILETTRKWVYLEEE